MRRLTYREGMWFAVPLRNGGYAVGIVARKAKRGVLLGYFFGPRRQAVPVLEEVERLKPNDAILVKVFGDLGLLDGSWPIIGLASSWDRGRWPMAVFGRVEEFTGRSLRVEY